MSTTDESFSRRNICTSILSACLTGFLQAFLYMCAVVFIYLAIFGWIVLYFLFKNLHQCKNNWQDSWDCPQAKIIFILIGVNSVIAVFVIVCFGFMWIRFSRMKFLYLQARVLPSEVCMSNEKAVLVLAAAVEELQLQKLSQESAEYAAITDLVKNTWVYSYQSGKDAYNLQHESIEIKDIYLSHQYTSDNSDLQQIAQQAKEKYFNEVFTKANASSQDIAKDVERQPLLDSPTQQYHTCTRQTRENNYPNLSFVESHSQSSDTSGESQTGLFNVGFSVTDETSSDSDYSTPQPVFHDGPSTSHAVNYLPQTSQQEIFELRQSEVFLFHGTKISYLKNILTEGFNIRYTQHGLYGKGLYFAESSEKADQYADRPTDRRSECLTMLLAKVSLGQTLVHSGDTPVHQQYRGRLCWRQRVFDSVVAGFNKRFKEFLVFEDTKCQPAYLIVYNRINSQTDQVSG